MITNKSKGFTIIELLVVVAIIAVLAAIVLVNVTGYINQGKNAAIKGNLATVLTNGAVYYDANNDYDAFCASAGFTAPSAAITGADGTAVCVESTDDTAWCACSTMNVTGDEPAGTTFCVDSTGTKKATLTACTGVGGRCLAATGACTD